MSKNLNYKLEITIDQKELVRQISNQKDFVKLAGIKNAYLRGNRIA